MLRFLKRLGKYRDWRMVCAAGVLGFALTLAVIEAIDLYSVSLTALSITLAAIVGSLIGMCVVGATLAFSVSRKLSDQNVWLDAAINNMIQGLCMFDAQNRLMVWNKRYLDMYKLDPGKAWRGSTIRDLLDARTAAGTFPLDAARYDTELRAALKNRQPLSVNLELADGRVIAVINQPTAGGGWVATHEDITERKRAERELENTRSFLDTIIENVPSPIIVKDLPSRRYVLLNRAAEQYLGVPRDTMLGKLSRDVMPASAVDMIETNDSRLIEAGEKLFFDEHAVVTPGNGTRIATVTRLPVMGADGTPKIPDQRDRRCY